MLIHDHKEVLLKSLYLDKDDITIRRAVDGYFDRYKKGDAVIPFLSGKPQYLCMHIPKTRKTIKITHVLQLLRNLPLPEKVFIDHIDGDVNNNKRDNLRLVDHQINNCNRCKRSDNTSGITGIRWSDYHQHYVIRKTVNGKRLSRSRKTMEAAKIVLAELIAMDDIYTARHGK